MGGVSRYFSKVSGSGVDWTLLIKLTTIQAQKKNPNLNFWVRIFSGGVGGLPRESVGAKKFGMSPETQGIKLFWRDIPGFCRDIPEAPKKFEKKMFGLNFWPLTID